MRVVACRRFGSSLAETSRNSRRTCSPYEPTFAADTPALRTDLPQPQDVEKAVGLGFDWEGKLSIRPADSDWVLKAGVRYGRSSVSKHLHQSLPPQTKDTLVVFGTAALPCAIAPPPIGYNGVCRAFFRNSPMRKAPSKTSTR